MSAEGRTMALVTSMLEALERMVTARMDVLEKRMDEIEKKPASTARPGPARGSGKAGG